MKVAAKGIKVTIKSSIAAIKALIKAAYDLISLIIAGGWVALVVILIICMVGLLLSSIFGIFFSNESDVRTMTSVISEVNMDLNNKIEIIKRKEIVDEININTSNTSWKEVIAIYSVKYNDDKHNNQVAMYLDDKNVSKLKKIFWDFNTIIHDVKVERREDGEKIVKYFRILNITINSVSKENIMDKYGFTDEQRKQVDELLDTQYDDLWMNLIYGSNDKCVAIVNIALREVGYTHGDKFWKWYGFDSRIEWCAVFVSWVANEADVLNTSIPKFSGVANGIDWFRERNQWKNLGYIPKPRDIIFFDWEPDGKSNHVGIVDHVDKNTIYTVEGNSTDDCVRQKSYPINSKYIFGFGISIFE